MSSTNDPIAIFSITEKINMQIRAVVLCSELLGEHDLKTTINAFDQLDPTLYRDMAEDREISKAVLCAGEAFKKAMSEPIARAKEILAKRAKKDVLDHELS